MSLDSLKVGFIGAGFVASFHAEAWSGVRNAEISAVYNIREVGAKNLSNRIRSIGVGKPKAYTNLWDMLSDRSLNAFWILSPNFVRLEVVEAIVEEALQGRSDIVGVCCEKPLARTADEAELMIELIEKADLLHGYLENQVFAPAVTKGREIVWSYGARLDGRPYLARAAEEHGGPHSPWFWNPKSSGGGVLLDMTCHSLEASRYLLSEPRQPREAFKPVSVQSAIASLKWVREPYMSQLKEDFDIDYKEAPAEDYALTLVVYEDDEGNLALSETRTSWGFVGPGLRLTFEVQGPEYSITINSLRQELNAFFGRNIRMPSDGFIEKQGADQGLMPIIPNEAVVYGYQEEDRHMVESFLKGEMPRENWVDGLQVVQLMMMAYLSAEKGGRIRFNKNAIKGFKPKVALGEWEPASLVET